MVAFVIGSVLNHAEAVCLRDYMLEKFSPKLIYIKGWKMNYKSERNLINEAINAGCQTVAQLALYIKLHTKVTA
jgi:hypothetical protein